MAIKDAKSKSNALAAAAGIKLGRVVGWYENMIQPVDQPVMGMGGAERDLSSAKAIPQVPSGSQDIIVEMNLNYEVK